MLDRPSSVVKAPEDEPVSATSSTVGEAETVELGPREWRKWVAFASAILNCLSAASIMLYSLWAPVFQQKLGYNQMQINAVSIAAELGLYLPVPVFGYICDHFGPDKLSLLTAFLFGPGYLLAAFAFSHELPYQIMVIAFAFAGMGTAGMYFSGITTCAKNFTKSRGMALSLPIASFGLSSLWQSQFISRVFMDENGVLMVRAVFITYAVYLAGVSILGSLCLQVFPEEEVEPERERLLSGSGEDGYGYPNAVEEADTSKHWINAETHAYLRDKTMWLFAAGLFLVTGPGEAFMNNMGTLIHTLYPHGAPHPPISPATHVSIIATTSTLARISAGILSDYLAPRGTSRMTLLLTAASLLLAAQVLLAAGFVDACYERFWLISALVGSGYGSVFTLAPTVVSVVWGTENFGTNWGVVMVAPAGGATVCGLLYAVVYDGHADDDGRCWGWGCYRVSFAGMAVGSVAALMGWALMWKIWRGRGVSV